MLRQHSAERIGLSPDGLHFVDGARTPRPRPRRPSSGRKEGPVRYPARILLIGLTLCLMLCSSVVARAASPVLPQILEPGFRVTYFDQCGQGGNPPNGPPYRPQLRGDILDIECAPEPAWGRFMYLAVSTLRDGEPIGR